MKPRFHLARLVVLPLILSVLVSLRLPGGPIAAAPFGFADDTTMSPDTKAQLEAARQVWRDGDPAGALPLYQAIAADPAAPPSAVLELGEVQLATGDATAARDTWQKLVAAAPDTPDAARAPLLVATADLKLGDWEDALARLDIASAPDGLGDLVALRRAEARAGAGNRDAALGELRRPEVGGSTNRVLLEEAGQLAERLGDLTLAGSLYAHGADYFGWTAERSQMMLQAGQAFARAGLADTAIVQDRRLIESYAWTSPARQAGAELEKLGGGTDYDRGLLALFRKDYAAARSALASAATSGPCAPQATQLLLAVDQEVGWQAAQAGGTAAGYRAFLQAFPTGKYAADAFFLEGLTFYQAGQYARALDVWSAGPPAPGRAWAFQRQGDTEREANVPAESPPCLRVAASWPAPGEAEARLLLWEGKALSQLGRPDEARARWQAAADTRPAGYYALRARDLLGGVQGWPSGGSTLAANPEAERVEAERWLATWADPPQPADPGAQNRVRRGLGLLALGYPAEAAAELNQLVAESQDPRFLFQVAQTLADAGLWAPASRAAQRVVTLSPDRVIPDAPLALRRLAYPPAYWSLLKSDAAARGVDPVLFAALVYQESRDDPLAISIADARGLSQVIPSTGRAVAAALGRSSFSPDDLYRPDVALQFGAYYVANQLRAFGGDPFRALAAYNAGARPVARWTASDPDLFVERIDIPEAKDYVRQIYLHEAMYRGLVG